MSAQRGVTRTPATLAATRTGILQRLGDAKVSQLHLALAVDEDVRWFDVAVDALLMLQVRQAPQHLEGDACEDLFWDGSALFQQRVQPADVHKLQSDRNLTRAHSVENTANH